MKYKKTVPHGPYKDPMADLMLTLGQLAIVLARKYSTRAREVFQGRNRRVYVMNGYVVKVPLNINGIADNDWEGSVRNGSTFVSEWELVYPPRKRLVWWNQVPVLFMEHVAHASSAEIRSRLGAVPKWVDRVDCGQVGFTKHGLLVAYDYGPR